MDTKIFLDTNIFLRLYNANDTKNVTAFMQDLYKHKDILIVTEQSHKEYLRNRPKVLTNLAREFSQKTKIQTSTIIRSLPEFRSYDRAYHQLSLSIEKIENAVRSMIDHQDEDYIYKTYSMLWNDQNRLPTTNETIQRSILRKAQGDPPGGDKETNGDEIIWETLINGYGGDLIIVSSDNTYMDNKDYLQYEYHERTQHTLKIVGHVADAFASLQLTMSDNAQNAEGKVLWVRIVSDALHALGGRAFLNDLYEECRRLIILYDSDKVANNTIESSVRRTLQQYSSDTKSYLGKKDLFHRVDEGLWELRYQV